MTCQKGRFPPERRLNTPAQYQAVFASGQRSSDTQFIILARPNGSDLPRLGFAIARSRIPRAVARNRLKRAVREYFRRHQDSIGGLDIVVMAQSRATPGDRTALRASLQQHWRKLAQCNAS